MNVKLFYFIKLFLIMIFSTVLLSSVEIAPGRPVLFFAVAVACAGLIRRLWQSVLRDEKRGRQQIRLDRRRRSLPVDLSRAA